MQSIDEILAAAPSLNAGPSSYYKILNARRALLEYSEDDILVRDGVCISLFYLEDNMTYELYVYEFDLLEVSNPKSAYSHLVDSESKNTAPWHKRLREFTPVYVKAETFSFSKRLIIDWLDYVQHEPEIRNEIDGLFYDVEYRDKLYIYAHIDIEYGQYI